MEKEWRSFEKLFFKKERGRNKRKWKKLMDKGGQN